jgi:hypothetical protein
MIESNNSWVRVGDAARYYQTTTQTIRNWCKAGTLVRVGCRVMRDPKGRWRILLPEKIH